MKSGGNYINNATGYIISHITGSLFIAVLEDNCSGISHTIGINRGLNIIYDYMKTH